MDFPQSLGQSVSRLVNSFSQKRAHRIFLKFYMKLEALKGYKLINWQSQILQKKSRFGGKAQSSSKIVFFDFCQKINPLMCRFNPESDA